MSDALLVSRCKRHQCTGLRALSRFKACRRQLTGSKFAGKAVIYLDNRIVFALVGGAWKPLAIDDLLTVAAK